MKKAALFFVSVFLLTTMNSCSFFGSKSENKSESKTSMAMEFVKQVKKTVEKLKKEKTEQMENKLKEDTEKGESVVLSDKDFEAYLTSLDYAIEKLEKQNKEIEAKINAGELGAMDILAYSMSSFATVFNPDEYTDKIAKTEEEKEHYEKAFGKIVQLYSYIGDKPVEEFVKENESNLKESKKNIEELKKKIEQLKKENPEAAKQLEGQLDFEQMAKTNEEINPINFFTKEDFEIYSKYQNKVCERNEKLKEQIRFLKKIFENFNKK